jgi:hypothetical protein
VLRSVQGEGQTDLVPAGIDKRTGLRALLASLGAGAGDYPLALAVGDAVEDLPMLGLATLGLSLANADAAVRESGARRVGRGYQAGLALAVEELIGHSPGACPRCRPEPPARRTRLLHAILGAPEAGSAHLALRAARLALMVRGPRAAG